MPAEPRPRHLPRPHSRQLEYLRSRLRSSIRETGLSGAPAERLHRNEGLFWDLDPVPQVIEPEEWAGLEAGLIQRARLVNAFLVDVYGHQQVLVQKLLPPEVILGDPCFRRPCVNLEPDRNQPATLLRFDLIRTREGWQCCETRADTPEGLGFVVQNRRFLSQEAADLYGKLPDYHSIINFPLKLLEGLRNLAPRSNPAPSIVVLTAGPHDPFHLEHSFLARKMGLPLTRGDDLLVLDNCVYFKTINGLERVDVIYRRLNDAHIDPVVFPTHRETAGVPGLIQCIRRGNVAIANSIGSGVADSRALDAYLPRLMRFYLGERPLIPSVPTYTCGDTDQLDAILESAREMTILPIRDPRSGDSNQKQTATPLLDEMGLAQCVRENPHRYVARRLSTLQPDAAGSVSSDSYHLSAFVLAQNGTYTVLPGGLARPAGMPVPADRIGICADTLVLQGDTVGVDKGPDVDQPAAGPHRPHALGSRAAETLFWLGRYLERAEATARMLAIFEDVALEEIPARDRRTWIPIWRGLLEATGHSQERVSGQANPVQVLSGDLYWRMTLSLDHPSSIASSIAVAAENGRQLRDFISPEAWVLLSRLASKVTALRQGHLTPGRRKKVASQAMNLVITDVNAFMGTAERTMVMDAGWEFLLMGVHLERAIMTCSALRHILGKLDDLASGNGSAKLVTRMQPGDAPKLSSLLRMLGSQDAYRRLFQTGSQPDLVASLFLKQEKVPRSLTYNLQRIRDSVRAIATSTPGEQDEAVVEVVDELLRFLRDLPLQQYFQPSQPHGNAGEGKSANLGELLAQLLERLFNLYPLLSDHYFSHLSRLVV
jgi:uncharacterized circularly permuted ATP-grasp superfamily protein/uncharacterized alpha-E superfamily protein